MTYDEAITWLRSRGGSLATWDSEDGGQVVASAEQISVAVTARDISNPSDLRRCEIEAIRQLRQLLAS